MKTGLVQMFRKLAWLVTGMVALTAVANTDAPEDFQVVDGVAIYLGVMPAQIVGGHAREHEERKMHGGVPAGSSGGHLVIALFDQVTGNRIEDAQVMAAVGELGAGAAWKTLEPMRIADSVTYGIYFNLPATGLYHVQLRISLPRHSRPVEATFVHRHANQ